MSEQKPVKDDASKASADPSAPVDGSRSVVPARFVFPSVLPVIALDTRPGFPRMMMPINLEEETLRDAMLARLKAGEKFVGLVLKRPAATDAVPRLPSAPPRAADLYTVGVIAEVLQAHRPDPEGALQLVLGAIDRFRIGAVVSETPMLVVVPQYVNETEMAENQELHAFSLSVITAIKELVLLNPLFKEELNLFLGRTNIKEPGRLADLAATLTSAAGPELQEILEALNIRERIEKVLLLLKREIEISRLQQKLSKQIEERMNKQQREFFLREQLKEIKKELGLSKDSRTAEMEALQARIDKLRLGDEARARIKEEMDKLAVLEPASPEYTVTRNYLDWLTILPWGLFSEDRLDIVEARRILDEDHYGLADVKERILEFLAVGRIKGRISGSILLLVGPPGVGKTSIGQSIARSVGRKFYRFSLGGMRDEAEIKGHRRTYIGAMPGKFLQALKVCATANPVLMLDEIDKIGASFHGDPASALLEVLDPEQNKDFLDHYLDVRFDLSNVLFVCTANTTDTIPPALLDRMETIRLAGYILDEKLEIAARYLAPKQLKAHGLTPRQLVIPKSVLAHIVNGWAREPGVRMLENQIKRICRKTAMQVAERKKVRPLVRVADLKTLLDKPSFSDYDPFRTPCPGVATGLAWTSMGGVVLHIEASCVAASQPGFKQTGQLGNVMVESSEIAHTVVRRLLEEEAGVGDFFQKHFVHLHVPAGATPKDGPSAGITMALALYSLATRRPMRPHMAMTGELTLSGFVLPIGGVKEKTLAARRAGIRELLLPAENRKDFESLPAPLRRGLSMHYVSRMTEVLDLALQKKKR